ncbi:MAG TPA: NosD domain-containing protein, partial [Candidatus Micrarchaeota archaeon]|nr:NosD domain-containing protein [Candidatus Micrarchaeota archaeon]
MFGLGVSASGIRLAAAALFLLLILGAGSALDVSDCQRFGSLSNANISLSSDIANKLVPYTGAPYYNRVCFDFSFSENVTFDCQGHKVGGIGASSYEQQEAFSMQNTKNFQLKNCEITGWSQPAISIFDMPSTISQLGEYADNNHVDNVTVSGNSFGVYLTATNNSALTNSNVSGNVFMGVHIGGSKNLIIDNVTISGNGLAHISDNSGRGIDVWSSNMNGIWRYPNNVIIRNSAIYNNPTGIFMGQGIYQPGGIYYESVPGIFSIYNNYFSNINQNLQYYQTSSANKSFNTTLVSGANIIGGNLIGGNFWNTYSNSCSDINDDGICDSPYSPGGTDYLPLTLPSLSVNVTLPANNSYLSSQNVTFNFTAISRSAPSMMCTVYVDNLPVSSAFGVSNNTPSSYTALNVPKGYHAGYVSCYYDAGVITSGGSGTERKIARSPTISFTISTDLPTVTLLAPADGYFTTNAQANFSFSPYDKVSTSLSCSLIFGGAQIYSGTFARNAIVNYSYSMPSEGIYPWSANCTNGGGVMVASATRTLYYDTSSPTVALNSPSNGSIISTTFPPLSFTPSDAVSPTLRCKAYLDSVNVANSTVSNGSSSSFSPYASMGLHTWRVDCLDMANHAGSSATWNFNVSVPDVTAPAITLFGPANGSTISQKPVAFNFSASDDY